MRPLRITLVIVAILAFLPSEGGAAEARPGARCAGRAKPTRVHSFHVEAEWNKKVYRTTDKAVVTVTVTRPAHEDPVELGIPITPPMSVPAEGIDVTTAVLTDAWPPPYGYGTTDANGQVTLKIPLDEVPPGKQVASSYAEKWTNQGGCPDIQEWGYTRQDPAFTVVP